MTSEEMALSLLINLFAGILIFLLGLFWPRIPKSYEKYILKRFWGKGVLGDDFEIVYGTYQDLRLFQNNPPTYRFRKQYHNGRIIQLAGPIGDIVGDCEIRSASYIINTISTHRKEPVPVIADSAAFVNLEKTFISLGSSSSNEITDLALRESNNTFLRFGQDNQGFFIEHITSQQKFYGFQPPIIKDYGIVLKIKNTRFPSCYFFVCAGLGEWGTSGAAWFLAKNWRSFRGRNQFGIVVEVEPGSDTTAKQVYPKY